MIAPRFVGSKLSTNKFCVTFLNVSIEDNIESQMWSLPSCEKARGSSLRVAYLSISALTFSQEIDESKVIISGRHRKKEMDHYIRE